MNKTPRLSKSGIEYLDYQWGIFSGCHNWQNGICPVQNCWAKGFATRFSNIYPNGFEPTFYPEAIDSPKHLKKPSIIGVGWVGDVIGYCNKVSERSMILQTILQCPQHTFLFLTKNPDRIISWGSFPDNCWVGVTATNPQMFYEAQAYLERVVAIVRYISLEPFLERIWAPQINAGILDWLIIGAQTNPYKPPNVEWVQRVVRACRMVGVPIFLKNNLEPILDGRKLIQELPK